MTTKLTASEVSRLADDKFYRKAYVLKGHLENALRPLGNVNKLVPVERLAEALRYASAGPYGFSSAIPVDIHLRNPLVGNRPIVTRRLHEVELYRYFTDESFGPYLARNLAQELLGFLQKDSEQPVNVIKNVDIEF